MFRQKPQRNRKLANGEGERNGHVGRTATAPARPVSARIADIDYNQPFKSPYQAIMMTFIIGLNKVSYSIPGYYLHPYPKLVDIPRSHLLPNYTNLPEMDEDIAHTFMHYLCTGEYETLQSPSCQGIEQRVLEYRRSAQVYSEARRYDMSGLISHAQKYLERFCAGVPVLDVLKIAREVFPKLLGDEEWFLDHLRERLEPAYREDNTLFMQDAVLKLFGKDLEFNRFLLQCALTFSGTPAQKPDESEDRTPRSQSIPRSQPGDSITQVERVEVYEEVDTTAPVLPSKPETDTMLLLERSPSFRWSSEPETTPEPEPLARVAVYEEMTPPPSGYDEPQFISEPKLRPEIIPEPRMKPEVIEVIPEPAPAPEAVPELQPEPQSIPEPKVTPLTILQRKHQPEVLPEPKQKPEMIPEPKQKPTPEPKLQPEFILEPKQKPTPEPKQKSDVIPEPKQKPETIPEPKQKPEVPPKQPKLRSGSVADIKAKPEDIPKCPKADAIPKGPKFETKPVPDPKPKPEALPKAPKPPKVAEVPVKEPVKETPGVKLPPMIPPNGAPPAPPAAPSKKKKSKGKKKSGSKASGNGNGSGNGSGNGTSQKPSPSNSSRGVKV